MNRTHCKKRPASPPGVFFCACFCESAMAPPIKQLTPRNHRFLDEYLVDLNGTQAAIRAGYKPGEARNRAVRLLRDPSVSAALKRAMAQRAARTRITADRVLKEYARIAFADIREVADWGSEGINVREPAALTDDAAAAIAEISDGKKGGRARLKLHDKKHALDAIARHLGLFERYLRPVGNPEMRLKAADSARAKLRARIEALAAAQRAAAEPKE